MKKFLAMLLAAAMVLSMTACGAGGSTATETKAQETVVGNTEAPTLETKAAEELKAEAEVAKDYSGRKLSLMMSIGGGGNWWQPVADRMKELYPGLEVEVVFDSTAADMFRTQYLAGEAPDAFMINTGSIPNYESIEQGIVQPVDYVLQLPTLDGTSTLGDILDMDVFTNGAYDGHYYVMHEFQYLNGFWYDAAFFREKNLTVPTDWNSFLKLCDECKALGIKVMGYTGVEAPEYAVNYWFTPMLASVDYDAYVKYSNLDSSVFDSDAMKNVMEKMKYLRDNDLMSQYTIGSGTSEAQVSFINHDFAIYPCGSWLEAEMADAWTEGWELTFLPFTFGDVDDKDHKFMGVGGQSSRITSTTKENLDLVGEFYRVLYCDEEAIRGEVATHGNVMLIPGFAEKYGDLVDPSVRTASACADDMRKITNQAGGWYPDMRTEVGNAINAYYNGDIDEAAFIQRLRDKMDSIRNDSTVTKYNFEG